MQARLAIASSSAALVLAACAPAQTAPTPTAPKPAPAASPAASPVASPAASPSPALAKPAVPSPSPAASPAPGGATVQVRADARLGSILADGQGRTLYTFDRDTPGVSACSGGCAQTWPPLQASGTPTGPGDLPGRLGTLERPDGGRQVTYNEMPLYTYAQDTQPGDTKGDGVGGNWHVAHP